MDEYKDLNPYEVLALDPKCDEKQIRQAYRKKALQTHPDKQNSSNKTENIDPSKSTANKEFGRIAWAYAILSDKRRRERYDRLGTTEESSIFDDSFDWIDYVQTMWRGAVSKEAIEEFKKNYQGSKEEKNDILEAELDQDEDRFIDIINEAINDSELKMSSNFKKTSSKKAKSKRKREATREAKEAELAAAELDLKNKSENDLAALIRAKHTKNQADLINYLEEKYKAPKAPKKNLKKHKIR